jgi:hypothetical protein
MKKLLHLVGVIFGAHRRKPAGKPKHEPVVYDPKATKGMGISIQHVDSYRDKDVYAAQFSAIIDGKTCPMCLSLDGRVVDKDSPFFGFGDVNIHKGCSCQKVLIMKPVSPDTPKPRPIPKAISDLFWDPIPKPDRFNQPETPIFDVGSRVDQKIKDGKLKVGGLTSKIAE